MRLRADKKKTHEEKLPADGNKKRPARPLASPHNHAFSVNFLEAPQLIKREDETFKGTVA
jgi:hypothetical protein